MVFVDRNVRVFNSTIARVRALVIRDEIVAVDGRGADVAIARTTAPHIGADGAAARGCADGAAVRTTAGRLGADGAVALTTAAYEGGESEAIVASTPETTRDRKTREFN